MVLSELGIKSKAFGFVAGFTGKAIEEGVSSAGIETDFVHLDKGFSRINVKIKSSRETELNAQGPEISKEKIDELFRKLDEIQSGDTIVLAGSIPSSLPSDIYEKILDYLKEKGYKIYGNKAVLLGTEFNICEGYKTTAMGRQKSYWLELE